jgi:hypothetical protein
MTFEPRRLIVKKTGRSLPFDAISTKDKATGRKFYTPTIRGRTLRKAWRSKTSAIQYAKLVQIRYVLMLELELERMINVEKEEKEKRNQNAEGEKEEGVSREAQS